MCLRARLKGGCNAHGARAPACLAQKPRALRAPQLRAPRLHRLSHHSLPLRRQVGDEFRQAQLEEVMAKERAAARHEELAAGDAEGELLADQVRVGACRMPSSRRVGEGWRGGGRRSTRRRLAERVWCGQRAGAGGEWRWVGIGERRPAGTLSAICPSRSIPTPPPHRHRRQRAAGGARHVRGGVRRGRRAQEQLLPAAGEQGAFIYICSCKALACMGACMGGGWVGPVCCRDSSCHLRQVSCVVTAMMMPMVAGACWCARQHAARPAAAPPTDPHPRPSPSFP